MGFLDSAGLARFTAWVKGRLAGKLDRTGGTIGEREQFSIASGVPESSGAMTSALSVGKGEAAIKAASYDPDGEPDETCIASVSLGSFHLDFGGKGYFEFSPSGIVGELSDGSMLFLDSNPVTGEVLDRVISGKLDKTATAAAATKLAAARTIRTNLASTSTAGFNGTANVTPGVTGILPVANGGTGASTAAAALKALGAPKVFSATLFRADWDSINILSLSVTGANFSPNTQAIQIIPAFSSKTEYQSCGIDCTAASGTTLLFKGGSKPSKDLKIAILTADL